MVDFSLVKVEDPTGCKVRQNQSNLYEKIRERNDDRGFQPGFVIAPFKHGGVGCDRDHRGQHGNRKIVKRIERHVEQHGHSSGVLHRVNRKNVVDVRDNGEYKTNLKDRFFLRSGFFVKQHIDADQRQQNAGNIFWYDIVNHACVYSSSYSLTYCILH